ncbi:TetR/AcrR family transcriptional regulator [Rhodococcus sp. F64268]|uniref:TetR/AcrR family transcriptional regulator n=1 Tax=Rhodococcus sp. F64268 TaxID=2926402 RepID=UPI001FF41D36|nr:TetR/AcrR family transcriptional regulator [Rhodococcus sp. F64268]MCK0090505.1 TetR/AcrR family transcriptional regulator [Rhodococcus sp. F64268]
MSEQRNHALAPSSKQQLVLTAERLYALHGLDGVPLRHISVAAGMANKSAVQYHFGTKENLIQAILINRIDGLTHRRELLEARLPDGDVRRILEAHQLPLIELAEDKECYYLPFLELLLRESHPMDDLTASHRESKHNYYDRLDRLLDHIPQPVRDMRIHQASAVCVSISADRHRMRMQGIAVAPYALHVSQLLDLLVSILTTPPSEETLAALESSPQGAPVFRKLP